MTYLSNTPPNMSSIGRGGNSSTVKGWFIILPLFLLKDDSYGRLFFGTTLVFFEYYPLKEVDNIIKCLGLTKKSLILRVSI